MNPIAYNTETAALNAMLRNSAMRFGTYDEKLAIHRACAV